MQRSAVVLAGLALTGTIGAASLAAIPDHGLIPSPRAAQADHLVVLAAGYGPVATPFEVTPLGEGQAPVPSLPGPARLPGAHLLQTAGPMGQPDGPTPSVDALDLPEPLRSSSLTDGLDCVFLTRSSKVPTSREKLVSLVKSGLDSLGAGASLDAMRSLVQLDLNVSAEPAAMKRSALTALRAAYPAPSPAAAALAKPFDLDETPGAQISGYTPCGNPAAIGGAAFGAGPFSNDFATINPVPVVASRLSAATEGGT